MEKLKQVIRNLLGGKQEAVASAEYEESKPQLPPRRRKRKPAKKVSRWLPSALMVFFIATFLISGIMIIRNTLQANKRDSLYTDLSGTAVKPADPKPNQNPDENNGETSTDTTEQTPGETITVKPGLNIPEYSPIDVDFEYLQEKNEDVMAWVYCPGTPINYPVVRGDDNDYYLNRLLDGTVNKSGSIFADCRNMVDFSDAHTIIYGHNMKDQSMFGSVNQYAKQDYYDQHPVWYINTPEQNYAVVLLAGHVTAPNAEIYAFKGTADEPAQIVQNALKNSAFKTSATWQEGERLVTFSTCHGNSRRFILVGVLYEIG